MNETETEASEYQTHRTRQTRHSHRVQRKGLAALPHYQVIVGACCFLFMLVNMGLTSTTFNLFQPYINAMPTMTDSLGSLVVSVRMLFAFLSTFVSAAYFRTLNCRMGVVVACLLTALGSVIFSFSTSFPLFCLGAACTGTSYGIGGTMAMTLVVGQWFTHNKATVLGIGSMGSGLAAIALPPVLTHIIETVSVSTAFLFEAALASIIALVVFLLLRNHPPTDGLSDEASAAEGPSAGTSSAEGPSVANPSVEADCNGNAADSETGNTPCRATVSAHDATMADVDVRDADHNEAATPDSASHATLSKGDFRLMQVAIFLLGGSCVSANAYVSVLMKTSGFDAYLIATLLSLGGVFLMAFKPVIGIALDKIGVRRGSVLFCSIFSIGQVFLCMTPLGIVALAFIGLMMCNIGAPISNIGVSMWALDFSDEDSRAQTIKRFQMFFTAGTFLGCLFPGPLYDLVGTYAITYVIFAVASAIACAIVLHIYRAYHL